jgi:GxxExxY protein
VRLALQFIRNGHLEKVYENALAHRLRKIGLQVEQHHPLTVYDEDGTVLGDYFADLFVEGCLIVELKACKPPPMSTSRKFSATSNRHVSKLGYSSTLVLPSCKSKSI